jgi:hypothetical protein
LACHLEGRRSSVNSTCTPPFQSLIQFVDRFPQPLPLLTIQNSYSCLTVFESSLSWLGKMLEINGQKYALHCLCNGKSSKAFSLMYVKLDADRLSPHKEYHPGYSNRWSTWLLGHGSFQTISECASKRMRGNQLKVT